MSQPVQIADYGVNRYQKEAARTADMGKEDALVMCGLGLTGEAGEFADHIKKWIFQGHDLNEGKVKAELGDIAWYLARACTALGVDLSEVLQANIDKLWKRYPDGFTTEASLARADEKAGA
jgi:NTP pyrophosphatase (non-canonical NTP hydrolase)